MDQKMEEKILQSIEGLSQKLDKSIKYFDNSSNNINLSANKVDSLSGKLDLLAYQLQEQTQILKRLLLLAESSKDAHAEVEVISSELKQRRSEMENNKFEVKNRELLNFICQKVQENKYDPDSDPVLAKFRREIGLPHPSPKKKS